jgi:threonyl-tRNA synthetase
LLEKHEIRALTDNRSETIGKKIRDAEMNKIPYMLIVGEQEENDDSISVRRHSEGDLGSMKVEAFAKMISEEIKKDLKEFNG